MAKKQGRYYGSKIDKALPGLMGESVSLILRDGQVHYLKLIRLDKDQLIGIDGTDRTHCLPIRMLEEVIAEKHA